MAGISTSPPIDLPQPWPRPRISADAQDPGKHHRGAIRSCRTMHVHGTCPAHWPYPTLVPGRMSTSPARPSYKIPPVPRAAVPAEEQPWKCSLIRGPRDPDELEYLNEGLAQPGLVYGTRQRPDIHRKAARPVEDDLWSGINNRYAECGRVPWLADVEGLAKIDDLHAWRTKQVRGAVKIHRMHEVFWCVGYFWTRAGVSASADFCRLRLAR